MQLKVHRYKSSKYETILRSGFPFFNRLENLIDTAEFSIHIQVYIFDTDQTGSIIISKLIAAAQRGVQVYIVVDDFASPQFTKEVINKLNKFSISVKRFSPFHLKGFKIGRRLHHKIMLFDEKIALVGGINIANKYSGYNGIAPWLDVAVEVSGPVCQDITEICHSLWSKRIKKNWPKQLPASYDYSVNKNVRLSQNDWWRRKIEISSAYRNAIRHAEKEITIMASYFLPSFRKRLLLKKASNRGVNINIILGGPNDVPLIKPAMQYLYGILLKNNIRIYEWKPTVLHGKMAIIDKSWTTIGSYNLNALSDYGSIELNVDIKDEKFAQEADAFIHQIIREGCQEITPEKFKKCNTPFIKTYRWMAYQAIRFSLFVLFVLIKRDRFKSTYL